MYAAGLIAALSWLVCCSVSTAGAQPIGNSQPLLLILGDSLSDTGNRFSLSGGREPPQQFYFQGRFSNGPVWVDDIANSSVAGGSWRVLNYAVGGARACDYRPVPGATPTPAIGPGKVSPPLRGVEILNLTQQVDLYLSGSLPPALHSPTSSNLSSLLPPGTVPNAVMVMIGSNDYLGELLDATFARENLTQSLLDLPEHVVGCVMGNLERLLNASPAILSTGSVIIANIPPIQSAPLVRGPATPELHQKVASSVRHYRVLLNARLQQLQQRLAQRQQTPVVRAQDGAQTPGPVVQPPLRLPPQQQVSVPRLVVFDLYRETEILLANASAALHIGDTQDACLQYGVLQAALTLAIQSNPQVAENGPVFSQVVATAADVLQLGTDVVNTVADTLGLQGVSTGLLGQGFRRAAPAIQSGGSLYTGQTTGSAGGTGVGVTRHSDGGDGGLVRRIIASAFDKVTSECDNPEDHFFWDGIHPTTKVHQRLAQLVAPYLRQ